MRDSEWSEAKPASPASLGFTRRGQIAAGFSAFVVFALLGEVSRSRPAPRMSARDWIDRQDELARALASAAISPLAWMTAVSRLAAEVDIAELMAEVGRAQTTLNPISTPNDPRKRSLRFVDAAGQPRRLNFGAALFDFTPNNVITPHGHRNMVSSHLVVEGAFRVRNFDRLRDEDGALIVMPTRDYIAATGTISAMSSAQDNVHWFVPHGGAARTFDVIISGIDPALPEYEITAIDPLGGERLASGAIRAPVMGFTEASAKYVATL